MISECNIFEINSFFDKRGALSILQNGEDVPFKIKRIYYLYQTKKDCIRGIHAHKKLEQILVAFKGKFEITLHDGSRKKLVTLDKPNVGLYVCPMIWREVKPLSDDGICVVLASRKYEEEDYIHNFDDFLKQIKLL